MAFRERTVADVKGPSAYAVAVSEGFTGTEQEWLDSLRMDPTPELEQLRDDVVADRDTVADDRAAVEARVDAQLEVTAEGMKAAAEAPGSVFAQHLSTTIDERVPAAIPGAIAERPELIEAAAELALQSAGIVLAAPGEVDTELVWRDEDGAEWARWDSSSGRAVLSDVTRADWGGVVIADVDPSARIPKGARFVWVDMTTQLIRLMEGDAE